MSSRPWVDLFRSSPEPHGAARDDGDDEAKLIPDPEWARTPGAGVARGVLQQTMLFPLLHALGRPEIIGADDLVTYPQPAVIAPNHSSHVDTALMLRALPRTWRSNTIFAAASDHFYANRALGASVSLLFNSIPFERRGRLRGLRTAEKLLAQGWNVVMFAQGTRRAEGDLDQFHPGVGRVCLRAGVPAIPVWISGSGRMLPPYRGLPRFTPLRIAFGRPIHAVTADDHTSFAARIEAAVKDLAAARGDRAMVGRAPIDHFTATGLL